MLLFNTLTVAAMMSAVASFSSMTGLQVSSSAFTNNGYIPSKYSCEGDESSPPLSINNIPAGAKSLTLIVHDPDAQREGGFTHWVVFNIDITDKMLPENFKGAVQGLNGAGNAGYKGMCPPTGVHHYHFMVFALDTKLNIDAKTDKTSLEKSMQGHILAQGEIVGLYKKT